MKDIEGMSLVRDGDREGMRIVVEVKRDAQADIVLNWLYRCSAKPFGCNMRSTKAARVWTQKSAPLANSEEVVTRRTAYDVREARKRAHCGRPGGCVAELMRSFASFVQQKTQEARRGLMEYTQPAEDIRPLIELLDEPGRVCRRQHPV